MRAGPINHTTTTATTTAPAPTESTTTATAVKTTSLAAPETAAVPAAAYGDIAAKYTSPASSIGTSFEGYRWDAKDLDAAMKRFAIGDAMAVIKTAIALDRGSAHLSDTDLQDAARLLSRHVVKGHRWAPTVLADIMQRRGIAEETALLRTAKRFDAIGGADRYLNRAELERAADVLTGVVGANDIDAVTARFKRFEGQPGVVSSTLGVVDGHEVKSFTFGHTGPGAVPKLKVVVTGGVHGNEPCGVGAALLIMEQLLASPALREGVSFTVVPMVNPRGYAQGTRRTPEDVDLNRHFKDAPSPISPEIEIIQRLFDPAGGGFDLALDLHAGYAARDGFWLYHRDGEALATPAMQRFAQDFPALSQGSATKPLVAPGVVQTPPRDDADDEPGTLKDYARDHGCRWSFTIEAPGSVSYLDQVLGEDELVFALVDQARLATLSAPTTATPATPAT
jgi:predicted deacylase